MKQIFLSAISLVILFCQFSCSSSSFVSYDSNIESVIVTTNESNIRGMSMLGYITVSYKIPMLSGGMTEDEMRQGALQRLKKKAKKEGAKVVLIQEESFTPFDPTYKIRGTAYK